MIDISSHPNGLRLVTCNMPYMHSASVGIWVGAGGRYETNEISGISHFIEHLVFKGTKKREGNEISQAIEGLGGMLNAFTGEEYTCYYSKVLSEYFPVTFDVLWDMVMNTYFVDENIEKEKLVVKEEINMYYDLPAQYVHDLLNEILWPDQPLGKMLIGTVNTIDNLNNDSILAYKNEFYKLNNIVVAVAGKINHDEVKDIVFKYMDDYPLQTKPPAALGVVENQQKPVCLINKKDTEQVHLAIGVRAFHREHEDKYALKVLNTIFGENMSSRLFQVIREKHGLAYSIHSSIDRFKDTGSLTISAGTEEHKLNKTLELVVQEMNNLKKEPVTEDELDRAKKYLIGQLSMGLEKTMNIMMWLGENILCEDKVTEIDEILNRIKRVTLDDVQRISNVLFQNNRLNLAVIGPVKNEKSVENVFCLQ